MLDSYYGTGISRDQRQRLLAVQAALEIAKASVGNFHASTASRADDDLKNVAKEISGLADAIQAALDK